MKRKETKRGLDSCRIKCFITSDLLYVLGVTFSEEHIAKQNCRSIVYLIRTFSESIRGKIQGSKG